MGKKKHKKAQAAGKQAKVQADNSQQTAEQVAGQVEDVLTVQEAEQEVPTEENLQGEEAQEDTNLQVSEVQEERAEDAAQEPTGTEEETVSEENAETEETAEECPQEPETPVVQIKEWHESESATGSTEEAAETDEAVEKKTKILMWAGIAMLVIVVIAGIAIGIARKDKESVPASSGNVATPTGAADEVLTETPAASQPTSKPEVKPTDAESMTPTEMPTVTPTPTPSPTPEHTKAPTVTPTPVVVGDIDVSKYDIYSSKEEGWGIGKNTEHLQPTAWGYDDKYKFDEVGAWYVDKNATEDDKVIYLTFNCGYEVGYTPGFLEVLKKHDVKASWFVLEEYIRQCPEEIRWLMENGHLVGSHSAYHLNYGTSSPEKVIADMLKNEQRMRDYVGLEMHKIMRPPSGYYNEQTLRIMKDMGYKIYFYSLAYPDWDPNDQPSEEYILNYFKTNHHNGAIAVIHITSGAGMRVLDEVITMLKAEGYRFGLVSEIE